MKLHKWLDKHGLPRIHGCIWDRDCRLWDAPLRVELFWGRWGIWVDLPNCMRNRFDKGRRSWSRGEIVIEFKPDLYHYRRWSFPPGREKRERAIVEKYKK